MLTFSKYMWNILFVAFDEGGPAGRLVGRLVFGLGVLFVALQIINAFVAG